MDTFHNFKCEQNGQWRLSGGLTVGELHGDGIGVLQELAQIRCTAVLDVQNQDGYQHCGTLDLAEFGIVSVSGDLAVLYSDHREDG